MSLYRLLGRDCLKEDEVRPYPQSDLNDDPVLERENAARHSDCRELEFDSLDVTEFGPYLLLLAAEQRAQEILDHAAAEAERLRGEAAREAAARGRDEAKQELLPSLVAFANAGQALIVFEERLISLHKPHLVRLALDIAEKIIHKAVQEDPQIVAATLERAKRAVSDAKHIRIWLHPKDFDVLRGMRPDLVTIGQQAGRTVEVAASEELSRGGCQLETEIGIVDATIPTQIEEVRRQLLDEECLNSDQESGAPAR
jgi:flagellar biosynthesis/type III secretory pathway protein FliH